MRGRFAKDMTGQVFGRLTVVQRGGRYRTQRKWWCRCECGNEVEVLGDNLRRGHTRSCGCFMVDQTKAANTTHGEAHKTAEWSSYQAMINRCERPSHKQFKDYGGRGIRVCERWRQSYAAFLTDMGRKPTPSHSIDRYPDPDGDYEPGNCRWATRSQQERNKRSKEHHDERPRT